MDQNAFADPLSDSDSDSDDSYNEREQLPMVVACKSNDVNWLCNGETPYNAQNYPIIREYRAKVVAAGSWAAYERAHRARLTKVLEPKFPQIPAEIVPTIVAFAFHTGWY